MQDIQNQQMALFKALFSLKGADGAQRVNSLNVLQSVIDSHAFDLSENLKFPCYLKGESALTLAEYYDPLGQASTLLLNAGARVGDAQKNAVFYNETLLRQKIYCQMQLNTLLKQFDEISAEQEANVSLKNADKNANGKSNESSINKKAKRKPYPESKAVEPVYIRDMVVNRPMAVMPFIQNQNVDVLQATLYEAIKALHTCDEKQADICRNFIRYVFISQRVDFEKNFDFSHKARYDSPLTAIIAYERSDKLQHELFAAGVCVKKEQAGSDVYLKACFRQKFYQGLKGRIRG